MRARYCAIIFSSLIMGCFSAPAFAACTGTPTYQDQFKSFDPSWGSPSAILSVQNGAFYIKPNPGYSNYVLSQSNFYGDGSICVSTLITQASDPDNATVGVLFWGVDYNNLYALWVGSYKGQGGFTVQRESSGRWLTPVAWRSDTVIKPGLGDANQVEVDMKGGTATVSINGKELVTFNGTPPNGGGLIGIAGSSGAGVTATYAFQNFQFFASPAAGP
ncbi:MAG TPA: hypothetical protein VKV77_06360 [Methylovirgula sp.]|nr:hypothetical protein [Methylovirgula sp.]